MDNQDTNLILKVKRLLPANLELAMIAMDLGELLVSEKIFFLRKNYKEKMIYLFQQL